MSNRWILRCRFAARHVVDTFAFHTPGRSFPLFGRLLSRGFFAFSWVPEAPLSFFLRY
jgi:hypothetical protein